MCSDFNTFLLMCPALLTASHYDTLLLTHVMISLFTIFVQIMKQVNIERYLKTVKDPQKSFLNVTSFFAQFELIYCPVKTE